MLDALDDDEVVFVEDVVAEHCGSDVTEADGVSARRAARRLGELGKAAVVYRWRPRADGSGRAPRVCLARAGSELAAEGKHRRVYLDSDRSIYEASGGSKHAATATVYAWARRLSAMAALYRAGLVDDGGRDTETRRKVGTIVAEVARIVGPVDQDEPEEVIGVYRELRDRPLDEVRRISRQVRAQAAERSGA